VVGEEAHIVARNDDGPRGESSLSEEQRDEYANLILLCSRHHTIVDQRPDEYPVHDLQQFKSRHEARVQSALGGSANQVILETYARLVDDFGSHLTLGRWSHIVDGLTQATPCLPFWAWQQLDETKDWLAGVIRTGELPPLESAFENFRLVLVDLLAAFDEGDPDASRGDGRMLWLTRPSPWQSEKEAAKFDELAVAIANLAIELTRAGNHLCNRIRQYLSPSFRLREGALMIEIQASGTARPEYRTTDGDQPYLGRASFEAAGPSRDHFLVRA
jgi:hypothetical protein